MHASGLRRQAAAAGLLLAVAATSMGACSAPATGTRSAPLGEYLPEVAPAPAVTSAGSGAATPGSTPAAPGATGAPGASGASGAPGASADPVPTATAVAVLEGWDAALDAYDDAARTADWDSAALRATQMRPELQAAVDSLLAERLRGETSIGVTTVVRASVERVLGTDAWVLACVDDGQVDVDPATGQPVPGPLGQAGPEIVRSLMVRTSSGWKLSRQQVEEEPCP